LVARLGAGSASAETRLHALYSGGDSEQADAVLDALAASAADGSPYALELLLALVSENRLAAGAIDRHIDSKTVAEEVEQEVLIAVARSIHRYRGDAKFTTWLYSLARNTAVTEIRKQQRTAPIDDEIGLWDQRRVSSLVAERNLLREAIYSLPPVFRETVLLRDVERLSYSEIAERQGLAINTVRSRLSRGRALLAASLPEQRIG
jgi:RNA polymerase sigma-70 factor (ECF subfamily)